MAKTWRDINRALAKSENATWLRQTGSHQVWDVRATDGQRRKVVTLSDRHSAATGTISAMVKLLVKMGIALVLFLGLLSVFVSHNAQAQEIVQEFYARQTYQVFLPLIIH